MKNALLQKDGCLRQKDETQYFDDIDEKYLARCLKRLKEWGAPLKNWYCVDMIEYEMPSEVCELCDYDGIKYVHVMRNEFYFEDVKVGCICAGIMEGDILAAKNRDRKFRNRAKRRKNFIKREWIRDDYNSWHRTYKKQQLRISKNGNFYNCSCDYKTAFRYKGKGIDNFLSACYAAFDLADPISEVWK